MEITCTIYFSFRYYIFLFRGKKALNIFSIFYTHHRIPNNNMMTINFDTITNNYEVIYVMKYYLKKIDMCFHQHLPIMVHVYLLTSLHDAIWFINIHEQITHDFWLWADENSNTPLIRNISLQYNNVGLWFCLSTSSFGSTYRGICVIIHCIIIFIFLSKTTLSC